MHLPIEKQMLQKLDIKFTSGSKLNKKFVWLYNCSNNWQFLAYVLLMDEKMDEIMLKDNLTIQR